MAKKETRNVDTGMESSKEVRHIVLQPILDMMLTENKSVKQPPILHHQTLLRERQIS